MPQGIFLLEEVESSFDGCERAKRSEMWRRRSTYSEHSILIHSLASIRRQKLQTTKDTVAEDAVEKHSKVYMSIVRGGVLNNPQSYVILIPFSRKPNLKSALNNSLRVSNYP